MHVINIPRSEAIELVQAGVDQSTKPINAADAILLKRQAEQAPHLSFGLATHTYNGKRCGCPAVRAGLDLRMGSDIACFAVTFDNAVREKYALKEYDDGVLVIV